MTAESVATPPSGFELIMPEAPRALVYKVGEGVQIVRAGVRELSNALTSVAKLADPRGPLLVLLFLAKLVALTSPDRPLGKALMSGGAGDRLLEEDGIIDQLLTSGALDQLLAKDGTLERLMAQGGTLNQIAGLLDTLSGIAPNIAIIGPSIKTIDESAKLLSVAVGRIPGLRRKDVRPEVLELVDNVGFTTTT